MKLFRDAMIPLVAILILLALLIVVIVLIYEQKGIMLPFAILPDAVVPDTTVWLPDQIQYIKENIIIPNWRISK